MKWGADIPAKYDLVQLRVLGWVGEPINPEAWMWYRDHLRARHDCPIVDTWWQTETGAHHDLPAARRDRHQARFGDDPAARDQRHRSSTTTATIARRQRRAGGYLVIDKPWPAMLRTIFGDDERYKDTYWSRFADQGYYFAGDGAKYDTDGALWLLGRVDDVMNISGHRISTTEVESALVSHPGVAEAAVVGANDEMTGQGIVAFVILKASAENTDDDWSPNCASPRRQGDRARSPNPREILVVPELPKTRAGKIMRRLLRDIAENRDSATPPPWSTPASSKRSAPASSPTPASALLIGSVGVQVRAAGGRIAGAVDAASSVDMSPG